MYRRSGLVAFLYLVVGILVAAGVIGDDNYLSHLDSFKQVIDAVLAVLLWPLVLLGVHFHVGGSIGGSSGGGGKGK